VSGLYEPSGSPSHINDAVAWWSIYPHLPLRGQRWSCIVMRTSFPFHSFSRWL